MKSNNKKSAKRGKRSSAPTPIIEIPTSSILNNEEFVARFQHLDSAEDHDGVVALLTPLLEQQPNNHGIMILLGRAHLSMGRFKKSLYHHIESLAICNCVHGTFYFALCMKIGGQVDLAINLWKTILDHHDSTDPDECSPCNCCCEVFEDRISVITNTKFMISVSYLQTRRPRLSLKFKRDYVRDFEAGVKGMYPAEAIDQLKEVVKREYVEEN